MAETIFGKIVVYFAFLANVRPEIPKEDVLTYTATHHRGAIKMPVCLV